jgi:hypothetical protein
LVLNWGDGTLGNPVDGISKVGGIEILGVVEFGLHGSFVSVHLLLLIIGPVRHEVVTAGLGGLFGVALLNLGVSVFELGSSESVLGGGSIGFSVLGNIVDEFVVGSGHNLRVEKLGSFWGLVVKGNDGKGGGGTETSNGGLSSHV